MCRDGFARSTAARRRVAATVAHVTSTPPPDTAVRLFDGTSLAGWESRRGGPAGWRQVEGGAMEVVSGAGDILTTATFDDFQLHLEFWLPNMPWASGQQRANSGVYLQGRYELQLLDSYGVAHPKDDDCGALYKQAAPLQNANLPPEHWQSLEVVFVAPRPDRPGCLTVLQNGIVLHAHVQISKPTPGGLQLPAGAPGPILLQEHGDPVRFRNIWVAPVRSAAR